MYQQGESNAGKACCGGEKDHAVQRWGQRGERAFMPGPYGAERSGHEADENGVCLMGPAVQTGGEYPAEAHDAAYSSCKEDNEHLKLKIDESGEDIGILAQDKKDEGTGYAGKDHSAQGNEPRRKNMGKIVGGGHAFRSGDKPCRACAQEKEHEPGDGYAQALGHKQDGRKDEPEKESP